MVPTLDIPSYGVCYNVCYLWFRSQQASVTAIVIMFVIYGSRRQTSLVTAFVKLFVIYGSGVRYPQFRRWLVAALIILSYGHCNNVCYLWFRRQTSSVNAFVNMFVIYGSGVSHLKLWRLLTCLLSMVPALDILSYGHCNTVCFLWFRRLLKCLLSMVQALAILSQGVCYNVCYLWSRRQTSLFTVIVIMFVNYGSGVRHPQTRPLL